MLGSEAVLFRQRVASFFVYAVIAFGGCLLVFLGFPIGASVGVLTFALLTFAAEMFPVTLPRQPVTLSVSLAALLPVVMLFGPVPAVWTASFATIRLKELKGQVPAVKVLFNRAQLALSAGLASLVYAGLGGAVGTVDLTQDVLPVLGAGFTFLMANMTAVSVVLFLTSGKPFVSTWRANLRFTLAQTVGLTCLGVLLSMVYAYGGFVGVLLFTLPLALARYSFQQYVDLRDIFLATINALVSAIEAKDVYTHGHSTQTMEYATAVARQMGWSDTLIERLQYACVLHDIGKIGIADSILKKPSKLTTEEYEEQKRHPGIGADIVKSVKFLSRDVAWIRHHHERYDGRGYPDGLKGEEIPLGARIIAVADAFDAMTSARPYRPAMKVWQAVSELRAQSGSQFDPEVVKAFLRAHPFLDRQDEGS